MRRRSWLLALATAAITAGLLTLLFPRKSSPETGITGRQAVGPSPSQPQR